MKTKSLHVSIWNQATLWVHSAPQRMIALQQFCTLAEGNYILGCFLNLCLLHCLCRITYGRRTLASETPPFLKGMPTFFSTESTKYEQHMCIIFQTSLLSKCGVRTVLCKIAMKLKMFRIFEYLFNLSFKTSLSVQNACIKLANF